MSTEIEHPHWVRTVRIVCITQVAILFGFSFSFPFLPLFIQELGVTDRSELALWTGVSVGSGGIAMALAAPVWGLLADRLGRKAMLIRSVVAGSLVLGLQSVLVSVWQLVALRVVQGSFTGAQTAGAMLIAGIAPAQRTGFALGIFYTSIQVGNLIGPVLGGIAVVAIGLRGSFFVGALLLAVCAGALAILVQSDRSQERAPLPHGLRANAHDVVRPFGWPGLRGVLIVGGLVQFVYSATSALIAIYMQDLTRPVWLTVELGIGLSLAVGALAAAVAMPLLGSYADRGHPRRLLVVSLGLVAVSLVPQILWPDAVVFLFFRFTIGVGLAGTTSAIAVLTRRGAPAGAEGRAFGTLAAAQNLGWGIGPIGGSAVAAVAGIPALYLVAAGALVVLVVATALSKAWFVLLDPPA